MQLCACTCVCIIHISTTEANSTALCLNGAPSMGKVQVFQSKWKVAYMQANTFQPRKHPCMVQNFLILVSFLLLLLYKWKIFTLIYRHTKKASRTQGGGTSKKNSITSVPVQMVLIMQSLVVCWGQSDAVCKIWGESDPKSPCHSLYVCLCACLWKEDGKLNLNMNFLLCLNYKFWPLHIKTLVFLGCRKRRKRAGCVL